MQRAAGFLVYERILTEKTCFTFMAELDIIKLYYSVELE